MRHPAISASSRSPVRTSGCGGTADATRDWGDSRSSTCASGRVAGRMSAKLAALVARINEGASGPNARWTYEGAVPFGDLAEGGLGALLPSVQRFRLGNGLRLLLL